MEEGEGETLDLYFEMKDMTTSLWPSEITLKQWRMDLKFGDIVDVLFTDSASSPTTDITTFGPLLESISNLNSASGLALEEKLETLTRTELIVDTEKEKHWVEGKIIKIGEKSYGYRDSQILVELYIAGTERYLQSQNDVPSKEKFGDSNYVYPSYVQNSKILGQYSLSSSFVQPLYSHSIEWRKQLTVGSKVYALIKKGSWMRATVISLENDGGDENLLFLRFDDHQDLGEEEKVEADTDDNNENDDINVNVNVDKLSVDMKINNKKNSHLQGTITKNGNGDNQLQFTERAPFPLKESAPMYKSVSRYGDDIAFFMAKQI